MTEDLWGEPLAAESADSVDAWNAAWAEASHFVGDPFVTLDSANRLDESFAMGSVFCGTYRILGGTPSTAPELLDDHRRAVARATSGREQGHVEALTHLVVGDFTKAARQWDAVALATHDYAAVRFAHDVYLHVGDQARRLRSSQRAFDQWERDQPGWGFIAGQLSFALEESGFYAEAEQLAQEALAADPMDLWALHSLAHLYETLDDSDTALEMLRSRQDVWAAQDGLAVHIWWHFALRLIATGQFDEALAVHDDQLDVVTTPFRLCDMASLLWRLEIAGVDVGDRWDVLADRFADRPEWHTSGFLDLHAAFTYSRRPDHNAAARFFAGVAESHSDLASQNDFIFAGTAQPLVAAIRDSDSNPAGSVEALDAVANRLHTIGGSIAQRDIVSLTNNHLADALAPSFSKASSSSNSQPSSAPEAT